MQFKDWTTLKTADKVAFKRQPEVAEVKDSDDNVTKEAHIVLAQKQFNPETGEAIDDSKSEYSLQDLEREKASYDKQMAEAKAESDELKKMIADFKKL